uniref:SET domain-containing protein n=1 Tax=Steinernema glaseri TaxID=37863 RepID=A0A1I7ZU06_9BILA
MESQVTIAKTTFLQAFHCRSTTSSLSPIHVLPLPHVNEDEDGSFDSRVIMTSRKLLEGESLTLFYCIPSTSQDAYCIFILHAKNALWRYPDSLKKTPYCLRTLEIERHAEQREVLQVLGHGARVNYGFYQPIQNIMKEWVHVSMDENLFVWMHRGEKAHNCRCRS